MKTWIPTFVCLCCAVAVSSAGEPQESIYRSDLMTQVIQGFSFAGTDCETEPLLSQQFKSSAPDQIFLNQLVPFPMQVKEATSNATRFRVHPGECIELPYPKVDVRSLPPRKLLSGGAMIYLINK